MRKSKRFHQSLMYCFQPKPAILIIASRRKMMENTRLSASVTSTNAAEGAWWLHIMTMTLVIILLEVIEIYVYNLMVEKLVLVLLNQMKKSI